MVVDFLLQLCGKVSGLLPPSEYLISTVCQLVFISLISELWRECMLSKWDLSGLSFRCTGIIYLLIYNTRTEELASRD